MIEIRTTSTAIDVSKQTTANDNGVTVIQFENNLAVTFFFIENNLDIKEPDFPAKEDQTRIVIFRDTGEPYGEIIEIKG